MEQKTKGISKKNIYLILLSLAIVAVVIAVTIAIANSSSSQIDAGKSSSNSTVTSTSKSTVTSTSTTKSTSKVEESTSTNPGTSENSKPTDAPIVFVNPVSGGYLLTEYTAASVVYNQTLGIYTGHMGVDIAGEENAQVFAVYDGVIESIATSYLTGTTVTILHGDGLTTVYNSIETIDGLSEGQAVLKGEEIGVISTNNRQEYKDGAHLHFEVKENGKNIDPFKYLDIDGK
ncbi:MAG: M23 family metallopeptidase [Clostridia bacterium]|nr:M23 family metallopeptidase [Clostridia bacterium]